MTVQDSTSASVSEKPKPKKPTKPKFPLFLHKGSGQYAKKVRGRTLYFGTNADEALERWIREKDDLLAGRTPRPFDPNGLNVFDLCNKFLSVKEHERDTGELSDRQWHDLKDCCEVVWKFFGRTAIVEHLVPDDFAKLRSELAKGAKPRSKVGLTTLENRITKVRSIFNFASKNGLIQKNMSQFWGTVFNKPTKKAKARAKASEPIERMFTQKEVKTLLEKASPTLKAMILLGINCGLGNADIGALKNRDIRKGWMTKHRSKTGTGRRFPLWKETIAAIEEAAKVRPTPKDEVDSDRVFVTKYGSNWIPTRNANPISQEFTKLKKEAKITGKGKSFYTLRHVFQTIGDETLDFVAVKFAMGHEGSSISNEYREGVSDERLQRVSNHVHAWLFTEQAKKPSKKGGAA